MEQTKNDNLTKIRKMLDDGIVLTHFNVLDLIGTTEIRHYIAKIRKEIKVRDKWVSRNGKRWKIYWIDLKVVN